MCACSKETDSQESVQAEFIQKRAYGVIRYYPMNRAAESLCTLVRHATLKDEHLRILSELNFSVKILHAK